MAASPLQGADGVLGIALKVGGAPMDPPPRLLSLRIERQVNAIPWARLELADGDGLQGFPLLDAATLAPGVEIEVALGYQQQLQTVFVGRVTRIGLGIAGENECRLVVEGRDAAVAMTLARRSAVHVDQTDSDIAGALIGRHAGLTASVTATAESHRELVQFHCSDWDFLVARAEVNGQLVTVHDGEVAVAPPDAAAEPVLTVTYGVDLISFQGDIDARLQCASAVARAWDPAQQAAATATAAPQARVAQGNLSGETLAQVLALPQVDLQTGGRATADTLQAWADAWQLRAELARVRGRVRFQGHAGPRPGCVLELAGVGARFAGRGWVGAVRHEVRDGDWVTEAEFGLDPEWFVQRREVMPPPAGGLQPGVHGLQVGIVKQIHEDPAGQHRVQVRLPAAAVEDDQAPWARLLQFHASSGFGAFFPPEVGDEVLLGFLNADPTQAVVLGGLYSSRRAPPRALAAENRLKALVTRCGSVLEFDEDDKLITLKTPAANQLVFSDKDKTITLQDQNGNKIVLGPDGILLQTPKDVVVKATGNVKVTATQAIEATATADLKLAGLNVSASAQAALKAQGTASAELSASGQTTVKGALVMIN